MAKLTPEQLARIKEMAKQRDDSFNAKERHSLSIILATDVNYLLAHITALEAENARYKEALEKVATAKPQNVSSDAYVNLVLQADEYLNCTRIAKQALKGDTTQ